MLPQDIAPPLVAEAATSGGTQRLPLDVVVSSSNLTDATMENLRDDPDAPDSDISALI